MLTVYVLGTPLRCVTDTGLHSPLSICFILPFFSPQTQNTQFFRYHQLQSCMPFLFPFLIHPINYLRKYLIFIWTAQCDTHETFHIHHPLFSLSKHPSEIPLGSYTFDFNSTLNLSLNYNYYFKNNFNNSCIVVNKLLKTAAVGSFIKVTYFLLFLQCMITGTSNLKQSKFLFFFIHMWVWYL